MATISLEELFGPRLREIFAIEAERALKSAEAWDRMFPRPHTCQTREEYDTEVQSATDRVRDDDYPPTPFGEWLREQDEAMLTVRGK